MHPVASGCGSRREVGKLPGMVSLVPMKVGNVYENCKHHFKPRDVKEDIAAGCGSSVGATIAGCDASGDCLRQVG